MSTKLAYTLPEAAEAIGIGVSNLRTKIRNNELGIKYIGHKPVILATELAAYLESLPSEAPTK